MRTIKELINKLISVQLVLTVLLAMIFNIIGVSKVQAASYTQYKKVGISEFPEEYRNSLRKLAELHPNWKFTAFYTGMTWEEFVNAEVSAHGRNRVHKSSADSWKCSCGTESSGYVCASREIFEYYADPRNFLTETEVFQFLEMSYNSSAHTQAGVESIVKGSFMDSSVTFNLDGTQKTMRYSQIIMEAAKQTGISPYSIAIKIIQEVGRQGSSSVSGNYAGYEGYYNFFNIGAYDSGNAIENGLKYAKEHGWNNQYISIIQGSQYLADSYINVGQNTAYFYKFDVVSDAKTGVFWHQYMTNIQDPSSQAKNLYNTYAKNNVLNASLNFIIPVFNGNTGSNGLPSDMDENDTSSYYVNGTGVTFRSGPTTSAGKIATLARNEVVKVIEFNSANADGYNWAYVERSNGTKGYVANKYLVSCSGNTPAESSIARIEDKYIIITPKEQMLKISEIAKELNINSYSVTNSAGKAVDVNSTAITTLVLKDKSKNKSYNMVVLGEINGDGEINSGDLLTVKKHLLGNPKITDGAKLKALDVNRDGEINSGDLLSVKKYLLGNNNIKL